MPSFVCRAACLGALLLAACKKDDTPGPVAYTLTRSLSLAPAGLRLDTTYRTGQISLAAQTAQSYQQQTLFLSFGGETTKDELRLSIPIGKLRPGWVGAYTFVNLTGNQPPYTEMGEASANFLFRYYPNHIAGLTGPYAAPGAFVITKYDEKRHLLSGSFRYDTNASIQLPPLATGVQGYQLVLTGTFENLPVQP